MPASEGHNTPSHDVIPISIALLQLDARMAAALAMGNFASTAILHRARFALTWPIHDSEDGEVWRWRFTRTAGEA
jgi:hypothetical protein